LVYRPPTRVWCMAPLSIAWNRTRRLRTPAADTAGGHHPATLLEDEARHKHP